MKSADILRVEKLDRNERNYSIHWQMTHLCNYYCDFCVQGNREHHIERAKGESPEIREKICSNLIKFIEKEMNKKADVLWIYLIGGEIIILKDFMPILKRLMKAKFQGEMRIHITTNLSMDAKMCRELSSFALVGKRRKLYISCSYYKAFTTEDEFLSKINILVNRPFYQKIFCKYLKNNYFSVKIGYPLFTDQDYEEYLQFRERNPKYAQQVNPIIIRDYKTSVTQSVKEKLKAEDEKKTQKMLKVTWKDGTIRYFNSAFDRCLLVDEEPFFQPKGFLCDVGSHFFTIDPFGNMSRCVSAAAETVFGNLCEEQPEYMTEMLRCQAKRCACHYYSLIENDL